MRNKRKQKPEEIRVLMRNLEATLKELPLTLKSRCLKSLDKFAIRVRNYQVLSSPYEEMVSLIEEIPEDSVFTPEDVAQRINTNPGTASRALRYAYQENPEIDIGLFFRYKCGWFYRGQDAESRYVKLPRKSATLNENPDIELKGINTKALTKRIEDILNHLKERENRKWTKEDVEDFKEEWIKSDKKAVIHFAKENIQTQGYISIIPKRILEIEPFSHYNELTRDKQIDINLYSTLEDSPKFYLFVERVLRGMGLREAHFLQPQKETEEKIFYHPARLIELRRKPKDE